MTWTYIIRTGFALSLAALAGPLAAPAHAAVSDFRLPPPPAESEPPPARQGPVAPDVPESRAPPQREPAPAITAAPTVPTIVVPPPPAPTATAEPVPAPRTQASPGRAPTAPSARAAAGEPVRAASAPDAEPAPAQPSAAQTAPAAAAAPAPAAEPAAEEAGGSTWLWILLALAALGALGFIGWRRRGSFGPVRAARAPSVERPRLPPAGSPVPSEDRPAPAPAPAPSPDSREPLQVSLEPVRLSLTLINATLAYRLEVTNRGPAPLEGLRIGADMISAHASMSREEQLSGPAPAAGVVQRIERLEPGESRIVKGEFRLPFPQIVPIRQGNAALLMPLARFRLETPGAAPLIRTFVVGQPGSGDGLQPFRLDLGPRVYPRLAQRAFA